MEVKLFEVRDRATMIPVMAIRLKTEVPKENWLLWRAGYGDSKNQSDYIMLVNLLSDGATRATYDPFKWGRNPRTMFHAHRLIIRDFDRLSTGDVVDVEFLLGESETCKKSEQRESAIV